MFGNETDVETSKCRIRNENNLSLSTQMQTNTYHQRERKIEWHSTAQKC